MQLLYWQCYITVELLILQRRAKVAHVLFLINSKHEMCTFFNTQRIFDTIIIAHKDNKIVTRSSNKFYYNLNFLNDITVYPCL